MATPTALLDALFALGGVVAFGFLAWGAWLTLTHAHGPVAEGHGRFAYRHRRRARRAVRLTADEARSR
jgi:hypothetical protein